MIDINHLDYEELKNEYLKALSYIRQKTNQLLQVIGTSPVCYDEIDDRTVIELDPIGIVAESFTQILENLRNTNEHLQQSYEEIEALLNSIPACIVVIDAESRIILDVNPAAAELIGLPHEDIVGRFCCDFFCPNPDYECPARGVESGIEKVEKIIRTAKGEQRLILKSVKAVRFKNRRVFLESFIDITENKRLQEELMKSQRMECLNVLAGGIAHDFNNILTAIGGNISIAIQALGEGNTFAYERLKKAEDAAQRAQYLARQLLTFSKRGTPTMKSSSIKELLIDTVSFALTGKNIKVEFTIADSIPKVEIDECQISQVFQNLALNAAEAMPEGGVLIVGLGLHTITTPTPDLKEGRYIDVTFRDCGPGIPEDIRDRIFDPFFTTKDYGSGLGLSIVSSIVKKHGGVVLVDNHPTGGAVFRVLLPIQEEKPEVMSEPEQVDQKPSEIRPAKRVLIMDDDPMVKEVLGEMLSYLGHDYHTTSDGAEAVSAYSTALSEGKSFDLVIMDMTVPGGIGGLEATKRLKEIDPKVKVLIASGYDVGNSSNFCKEHGVIGVILKPFLLPDLKRFIEAID